MHKAYDIIIIGGGLAGLTCAIHLSKSNKSVLLIEKNTYPNHKVCGEYVSNEILPYLKSLKIDPFQNCAHHIERFQLSTVSGTTLEGKLPLGGFGISRFTLDDMLAQKASKTCTILQDTVVDVKAEENGSVILTLNEARFTAKYVVGAFGKRSNIDKELSRRFFSRKSPWLAVKAHYKAEFPNDLVALHHFNGGYCGLSKVENGNVNACYLTTFEAFKKHKNIPDFEKFTLSENPFLNDFFRNAAPAFKDPLTISQISFAKKDPVEKHIFMTGDSAGLIHPLCGNGMAMAIHGAKILSEILLDEKTGRNEKEKLYTAAWNNAFKSRLAVGRSLQAIFMQPFLMNMALQASANFKWVLPAVIKQTHGRPLKI